MSQDKEEFREMASPPCYAHELDPLYNGTLASPEVLDGLQELLEGERAGARIARESLIEAASSTSTELCELIALIQQDEIAWCKMLLSEIKRHGGMPSTKIGDFYGKTMAITDLRERLNFLNRGQKWVSRRINELLPQIADPQLTTSLVHMRDSHDDNIEKTTVALSLS